MKYNCYTCDCGCRFAIENFSDNREPICPNCGDEAGVDATGECMRDPHIEFDRD